ncbi:MAG: O-antigen ligase family protein [Ignavibacteriales bacterium]|nr:MAG: O-antigen ligase family protein [Ignavibacteriales bacterium]
MNNNLNKIISFIVPLTAMLIMCRAFPVLSFFYYILPVILFLTLAFTVYHSYRKELHLTKEIKIISLMILSFALWALLTSIWSSYPVVSITRAGYFILISVPLVLLGYFWKRENKNDLFGFLLPANVMVVIVSIYSLLTSSPDDAWTGGHGMGFMGYAGHQNTLASALVFTMPAVIYPLIKLFSDRRQKNDNSPVKQISAVHLFFFVSLLILNLCLTIITVSRGAVLTLLVLAAVFVLLNFRMRTIAVTILIAAVFITVLYFSSEQVRSFTFKTENTIGDRRKININATIEAAKHGGLFGIGYGISETPSDSLTRGRILGDEKRFDREKMISSLALVEETGYVGLTLFLLPIMFVFIKLFKRYSESKKLSSSIDLTRRTEAAFAIAVLAALIFHAQIEGWWVGVGSVQLPEFFLMLSVECSMLNEVQI